MKTFRLKTSFIQKISIPVLGLLLLLPFLYFSNTLAELIKQEEELLKEKVHNRLMLEAEAFQKDLAPQNFVENILRRLNRDFGFSPPEGSQAQFNYPAGLDPKLIDAGFIASASRYLHEHYAIKPEIFIAADCDLQNIYSYFENHRFKNQKEEEIFTQSCALHIAATQEDVTNILAHTLPIRVRTNNCLMQYEKDNLHELFSTYFRRYYSYFSNPPAYNDDCLKVFTTRFGLQRLYVYGYKIARYFIISPNQLRNLTGTYGLYFILIKGSDISPKTVLSHALKTNINGPKRLLFKVNPGKPTFIENESGIYFLSDISSNFFQTIQDGLRHDIALQKKWTKFFQNHSIATFLPASLYQSPNRKTLSHLSFLLKVGLIFVFFISAFFWFKLGQIKMSLNLKLKAAVAILVFIPVIGAFFIENIIKNSTQKLKMIKAQNIVAKGLRQLEQLEYENEIRAMIKFLQRKKLDAIYMFSKTTDFSKIYKSLLEKNNDTLSAYGQILYKDSSGHSFVNDYQYSEKPRKLERIGLYKIMRSMGLLDFNDSNVKKLQKEQQLISAYADSYWQSFSSSDNLAKESHIIGDLFSFSPLRKATFNLLSTQSKPREPYAIFYHEFNELQALRKVFSFLHHSGKVMSSLSLPDGNVDFAIFERHTDGLRYNSWPGRITGNNELRDLAIKAVKQKLAGSASSEDNNEIIFSSWIYKENSPLVFVAKARLNKADQFAFRIAMIPWLMLIYALIATILISNGLSAFFLNPVQVLLKGVEAIQQKDYLISLAAESQDEFAQLSHSFNNMTSGLLQREKMRRFVSDKLIVNLSDEQSNNSKLNRVEDICVLSSDIRSFTTITEKHAPEEVVKCLNDYLTAMEEAIRSFDGSIEKIVGDAIIASFSQGSHEDMALKACLAAREMKIRLLELNQQRKENNLFTIENGAGITFGTAIFGCAGTSSLRKEFVMLGDLVGRSEKLESLSKFGKASKIIIDLSIKELVEDRFSFAKLTPETNGIEAWELINEKL